MKQNHIMMKVTNAIEMFSKVYPYALMSENGFYDKIPKHWGLSKKSLFSCVSHF